RAVHRLSRVECASGQHNGDRRGSTATAAASQQVELLRLPEREEAVARRQYLQGSAGRRGAALAARSGFETGRRRQFRSERKAEESGGRTRRGFEGLPLGWGSQAGD